MWGLSVIWFLTLQLYVIVWLFSSPFFTAHAALDYAEKTDCVSCIDRESFATRGMLMGMFWPFTIKQLFLHK
jgi:hypothetical protein